MSIGTVFFSRRWQDMGLNFAVLFGMAVSASFANGAAGDSTGDAADECAAPRWLLRPDADEYPGLPGFVTAVTYWGSDGGVEESGALVAAQLGSWGFPSVAYVMLRRETGWTQLGGAFNARVNSLTVYRGDLIAAGDFSSVDGTDLKRVARWDGVSWKPLGSGVSGSGASIRVLAQYHDELIAAGKFTRAGGETAKNIARWNGSAWQPLGSGLDGTNTTVVSICVYQDALFAVGSFQWSDEYELRYIARWNGETWTQVEGLSALPIQQVMTYRSELLAKQSQQIFAWNGTAWRLFGTAAGVNWIVEFQDQLISLGYSRSGVGGLQDRYTAAEWSGAAWVPITELGSGTGYCAVPIGKKLIVGGGFRMPIGGFNVAAWDGINSYRFGHGLYETSSLVAEGITFLESCRGEIIVGGNITYVDDDESWGGLARWDGRRWRRLIPEPSWAGGALLAYHGDILITRDYSYSDSPLWRWNGSSLEEFSQSPWFSISSLGIFQDSVVAFSGMSVRRYDDSNGIWHLLGGEFELWTPEIQWDQGLISVLREFAGELYVGGRFTHADGVPANYVARWNGLSWRPVGAGVQSTYGTVEPMAMQVYRNALIVAGRFDRVGEITVRNIAGWDGESWFALAAGLLSSLDATAVYALETYNDELIAGGHFNISGGQPLASPARWDGQRWSDWGIALGGATR